MLLKVANIGNLLSSHFYCLPPPGPAPPQPSPTQPPLNRHRQRPQQIHLFTHSRWKNPQKTANSLLALGFSIRLIPKHQEGSIAYQLVRGSEPQLLDDPAWMGDYQLFLGAEFERILLPSPSGDRVAFYVINENKAQVWVLHIPSQKIEAKIELFLTETDEDPTNILSRYLWRQKMMQWSPDGRYLAVVAGLQGAEHSLLAYDFDAHERLLIAKHVQYLGLVDWSPDSHSVVYVSLPTLGPTVSYASVWAATVEGHTLPISDMSPSYMSISLGWLDSETIVIEDRQWEHPATNLRAINLNTGQIIPVFDDFTMDSFLLPDMQLLFYNIYEGSIYFPEAPTEMAQGIYLLNFGEGQLDLLLPSKSAYLVDWFPALEKFLLFDEGAAYFYDLAGEVTWETRPTRDIFPSPNGKYILIGNDPLLEIYNSQGILVWSTPASSSDRVVWLPDSSGFLHFGDSDLGIFVSLYRESSGWQAEILDNIIWTGYDYNYFILE